MDAIDSKHYLIDEYPLIVLPSLVAILDRNMNLAVLLQQVHYWLGIAERSKGRQGKFEDGRWWIYNSISDWHEQFFFLDERTVRRLLKRLIELGLLLKKEEIDKGAKGGSRTWFSIDYDKLSEHIDQNTRQEGG